MSNLKETQLIELFRTHGLKATPQRLAICNYILESKDHPTAEKIYLKIKKTHKTISIATVYKNLALLKELGLISELNFDNTHSRYDPNQNVHVNIICPKCDNITDYESDILEDFWQKIKSDIGNGFAGQRLEIYKICNTCLNDK